MDTIIGPANGDSEQSRGCARGVGDSRTESGSPEEVCRQGSLHTTHGTQVE